MGLLISEAVKLRYCMIVSTVVKTVSNHVRKHRVTALLSGILLMTVVPSSPSYALGVGAVSTDSYIGEPLSLKIPIFNVKNPDGLSVRFKRLDGSVGSVPLSAVVERKNSQLAIRISSQQQVSEPYISFVLDINDAGDATSKEFTVLLDLRSTNTNSVARSVTNSAPNLVSNSAFSRGSNLSVSNIDSRIQGSVMGPYDWAQPGQVASSFGPVLDGQSLWRVARRINTALDVSVDQMMWSLYQNNRDQFSSNSITSLKAGAVLKIPTAEQASAISELAAKAKVIEFSGANVPSSTVSTANNESSKESSQNTEKKESSDNDQSFQLTGINSKNENGAQNAGSVVEDAQSQEIIASLAEAVGNLTQEIIKKDRKISFLEEKVSAFEEYTKVNASDLPTSLNIDVETELPDSANGIAEPKILVPSAEVKEPAVIESKALVETAPAKVVSDEKVEQASRSFEFKPWYWFLIILLVLLIAAFLFRNQIMALLSSLNIFQSDDQIEFDPSEYHHVDVEELSVPSTDDDLTVENTTKLNGLSQKSILDAIKDAVQVDDPLSPQTVLELDGDFSYTEMLSEDAGDFDDEDVFGDDEVDLTFVERFDLALTKQDYGFALQLLDMARSNEIDDPSYHYNRLRMYESMSDEDAFYDYFCEIENDIPSYHSDMQTKISQLVLQMAQH